MAKAKVKAKGAKADGPVRLDAIVRAITITTSVVLFGSLGIGLLFGVERLERRVSERLAAGPVQIVFDWPRTEEGDGPTWLPVEFQSQLLELAYRALGNGSDPLSGGTLERIAAAADRTGWFERAPTVRREADGTIRVAGRWRIPAAVVRQDGLDYLVSAGGELLPGVYRAGEAKYRAIEGSHASPPREDGQIAFGEPWPGGEVQAGVKLLALVSSRPWWDQVRAVDVSDYPHQKRLTIVTDREARIVWGAPPGEAVPGEQTAEVRLGRLDLLASRTGRIDAGKMALEIFGPITLVDDSATGTGP